MDQKKNLAASVFTFLGGVSGLISIALIVWKGGAIVNTIEIHGRRLDTIEANGSIGLREHVKMDDERVSDIRQRQIDQALRMTHQEETLTRVLELFGEVKVINTKLDALKEQVKGVK